MKKERNGEVFEVTFIDGNDCKIAVDYQGLRGRVEVPDSATNSHPYAWNIENGSGNSGESGFETPQLALDSLYDGLIKTYLMAEEQKAFKREQACEELRKLGRSLDE